MKGILFSVIIGLIVFSSCKEDPITINGKENKSISITKGKQFQINLPEKHAGGQTWSMKSDHDERIIEYIKSNYHGPEEGTTDFIFEAVESGNTTVRLNLIEYSHIKDSVEIAVEVK